MSRVRAVAVWRGMGYGLAQTLVVQGAELDHQQGRPSLHPPGRYQCASAEVVRASPAAQGPRTSMPAHGGCDITITELLRNLSRDILSRSVTLQLGDDDLDISE